MPQGEMDSAVLENGTMTDKFLKTQQSNTRGIPKNGHKTWNQVLETDLYTPRGSTRLSVLASCKPSFSLCYWYSSEGEFHFEDLAQETIGFKTQPKILQTTIWVIPDFTQQTKLTLRGHQGSRSQINWHRSMNPLVSEMLDAFKILDPSDGAVKGLNPKFTGVGQWIHWFLKCLMLSGS